MLQLIFFFLSFLQLTDNSHSPSPDHSSSDPASNTPVVTIYAENPHADEEEDDMLAPDSKRVRLSPNSSPQDDSSHPVVNSDDIMAAAAAAASSNPSSNPLTNHEEHAVRQLITGEGMLGFPP